jgi:malonyl-CoA O-methyltransferase
MDTAAFLQAKSKIAAHFDRAADSYEAGAEAQMEILERAAGLMRGEIGAGELWCDVGSGGGALLAHLGALPDGARFVCLDLALAPLRLALEHKRTGFAVQGDIESPPIRPATFRGAAVMSALQRIASPHYALRNIADILEPSGTLYFSVFVDGSFAELVMLRSRLGLPPEVWLPALDELLDALDSAGFCVSADEIENFDRTQKFPDAISVLGSLSGIGVTATGGRLLSKAEIRKLCMDYTVMFSEGGKVPLTYRAVIGKAQKR